MCSSVFMFIQPTTVVFYVQGGRCNNEVQYDTSDFHFDDIGFGVPGTTPLTDTLPKRTICNAEVSRDSSLDLRVEAYAYCKKV